ncbi:ABC transporter ATP-binding protein [Sphaerimonospora mesophila]|uniref:ABC transporter ATP-binding protein n=1 Tax=Sphaerimonospora mesophila TaxID=37483 RepID=UPI0006E13B3F
MTPALEISGLTKRFGDNLAVDHIDLGVPQGSFFGLVGQNGAGKTTTLSMAVGLLRPDGGSARIFGTDVWSAPERAKAMVGVLPDGLAMPERLTGREVLTYLGLLRGLDKDVVRQRAEELLAVLELDGAEKTLVIEYSTGMRKKIGLATALLHAPRLLVLDEPFEAVDPVSAATIKTILRGFVAGGGSIVLSSHVMALVEQLCDHVAVIDKGRVAAAGTLDEVRGARSLEDTFVELVGDQDTGVKELSWLSH